MCSMRKFSRDCRLVVILSAVIVCGFFWSTLSVALTSTIADVRTNIRDEVREIVQTIDPEAIVAVDVVPEVMPKTKLPGTNVTLDETIITDDAGLPKIKSIGIIILTDLKTLPADTEKVIKTSLGLYARDIRVSVQPRLSGSTKKVQNIAVDLDPLNSSLSGIINQFATGFLVILAAACLIFLALFVILCFTFFIVDADFSIPIDW